MKLTYEEKDERITLVAEIVKQLRRNDLNKGHCFMIFDENLPDGQAYYEYPDSKIVIEQLDKDNLDLPRIVICELTEDEAYVVRQSHDVFR